MTKTLRESETSQVREPLNKTNKPRVRWPWVAPEVWTKRMLQALVNGVSGLRPEMVLLSSEGPPQAHTDPAEDAPLPPLGLMHSPPTWARQRSATNPSTPAERATTRQARATRARRNEAIGDACSSGYYGAVFRDNCLLARCDLVVIFEKTSANESAHFRPGALSRHRVPCSA